MDNLIYIYSLDNFQLFDTCLNTSANWMVVGHIPIIEHLVSFLTTGDETCRVYQFQNSGIVCLDASATGKGQWDWFIKWTLNPNIT